MDAYWNHFFRAKDLVPKPVARSSEPVAYPDDTPVRDLLETVVDPDPPFGLLDGVTPEELAAARIAKHKEILTPTEEPPVTRAMATMTAQDFTDSRSELHEIRATLFGIAQILDDIREAIEPGRDHGRP